MLLIPLSTKQNGTLKIGFRSIFNFYFSILKRNYKLFCTR